MQFNLTLTECSKTHLWTCKIKIFPGEKPPDPQPNTGEGKGVRWKGRGSEKGGGVGAAVGGRVKERGGEEVGLPTVSRGDGRLDAPVKMCLLLTQNALKCNNLSLFCS